MQWAIVNFKKIMESKYGERLDAEFYSPRFLKQEEILQRTFPSTLLEFSDKIDVGHVGNMVSEYQKSGIWLLQTQNVKEFFVDNGHRVYISNSFSNSLKKSKVKYLDILIARSGSFGCASLYLENAEANCADIIIVKTKNDNDAFYLVSFLNSKYGKEQLYRFASGGLQGHVNLTILENLQIPRHKNLSNLIKNIVLCSYKLQKNSSKLCADSNFITLNELGLVNWKPKHKLTFIKNYTDTQQGQRIDAEYYQPMYEDIISAIKRYKGGWDRLGTLYATKKGVEVGSDEYQDEGVPFIRVSNISPLALSEEKYISESLYETLKEYQPRKGEILLSKDGSPGIAYAVNEMPPKMIPSGGIMRLKAKGEGLNNESMTLILNSAAVQQQMKRDVGGSIILHWRPDQISNVCIPLLAKSIQEKIQQNIQKAVALRKKSRCLLECAKRSVEMAIEESEDKAMQWINEQREYLGL